MFGLGLALSLVVGWWLMRFLREDEEEPEFAVRIPSQRPADINIPLPPQLVDDIEAGGVAAREAQPPPPPTASDDLTQIDGIGPKYAATLQALGITTFAQLAQQDSEALANQLREQGLRISGERIRDKDWVGQAGRVATD